MTRQKLACLSALPPLAIDYITNRLAYAIGHCYACLICRRRIDATERLFHMLYTRLMMHFITLSAFISPMMMSPLISFIYIDIYIIHRHIVSIDLLARACCCFTLVSLLFSLLLALYYFRRRCHLFIYDI